MRIIDEMLLKNAVAKSLNLAGVMRELKRADSSAGRNTIKKHILLYNIDYSHFEDASSRCKRISPNIQKRTNDDIFVENSTYTCGKNIKKRLYDEGLKERKCELCGQGEEWRGKYMSLILDHKNGIHNDNRLDNLQIVCPNCNATLPTHCRGANGLIEKKKTIRNSKYDLYIVKTVKKEKIIEKKIDKYESNIKQRKVKRPPYEQLVKEINKLGYSGTGRKYGVSDNSIRKWIKFYEKYLEHVI